MTEMIERVTKALVDAEWWDYSAAEDIARLVIAAMREPTPEMIAEGSETDDIHGALATDTAAQVWRGMIDEALR